MIISDQKAIVRYHKDEGHNNSHHILIVVDDFADRPEVMHQAGGAGPAQGIDAKRVP